MKSFAALALLAAGLGCSQPSPDAQASARVPLKLQLPDGWSSDGVSGSLLRAGPAHRRVMTIEHRQSLAIPEAADVSSALVDEGATVLGTLPLADGWLVRYQLTGLEQSLIGARKLPTGTLLCASLPGASLDEVKAAASLCTSVAAQER